MSGKRYTEEFKIQAVKQITDQGHSTPKVTKRLRRTAKSLYDWKAKYADHAGQYQKHRAVEAENRALRAELKRVTMERDILKEAAADSMGQRNIRCSNPLFGEHWYDKNGRTGPESGAETARLGRLATWRGEAMSHIGRTLRKEGSASTHEICRNPV